MAISTHPATLTDLPPALPRMRDCRRFEVRLFLLLLVLCNLPLLGGGPAENLLFLPARVAAGEWWRLFTFPFVHVGWYHLALDGAAFFLLWQGLEEDRRPARALYLVGCWAGGLLLPWWLSPEVRSIGLCGLSGIAHGLMALTALELLRRREGELRRIGLVLLLGLLAKVLWEMATGGALLAAWHLGNVGMPIPAAHAGGVLGALAAFALVRGGEIFAGHGSQRGGAR